MDRRVKPGDDLERTHQKSIGRAANFARPKQLCREQARYFFMCLAKKSKVRFHATSRLSLWKLPRSSQWKPCPASL